MRKNRTNIFPLIAAIAIASLALITSCTVQPAPGPDAATEMPEEQPAAITEQPPEEEPIEPIELEFWTLLRGDLGVVLNEQIQKFNESQDRVIIINVEQGGNPDLNQKLYAAIAAGTPPDITMIDYILVPFFAQEGIFEPLNEFVTEEDSQDFIPGLMESLYFEDELYALPYNRSTQGLFYNKDLFRAAGLDPDAPPDTWEEVQEYARLLTVPADGQYGIYAMHDRWQLPPLLYAWGAQVNDEECNPTLNSPEAIEAMTFLQSLVIEGLAVYPPNFGAGYQESMLEFLQGKVAMHTQSTGLLTSIGNMVDFDWGFAMLPSGPAGRAITQGGHNIAMNAGLSPEEKAAAWEFMHFITSTEMTADFHMRTGYMPTRYSALELPEVQAYHEESPQFLVAVEQLEYARPVSCIEYSVPEWSNQTQGWLMPEIFLNLKDPETVLNDVNAELTTAVEDVRKQGMLINP